MYDAMENDNIVEAQTIVLEKSYCSSYFSTFWRKHRIVSPLIFIHPTLSSFSRGINVAFSVLTASFLITIGIFGMASEYVTTATIITGLILSRIVWVLLEMILHNKRQKYINIIQSIIITILLVLEGVVVFIPTKIHNQHTSLVSISIILFLLLEFILYELLIHAIHVFISRKLIKSPSNIDKMSSWTKHFLNPMVYDHINQFD